MTDSPAPPPFTDAPPNQAWVTVPVAEVIPAPGHARAFRLMTVIIMILLAGLLGAIGWWWWHSRGLEVSIEFERPHGLQIGASVMLNGVQVGEVRDIAILENHRIQVRTRLTAKPDINSMIARAGTQFWIPRFVPQISPAAYATSRQSLPRTWRSIRALVPASDTSPDWNRNPRPCGCATVTCRSCYEPVATRV